MSFSFDSIRAKIKNKSRETGIKPDVLYMRYLLERFICRIAASKYSDNIIIKGGMLISAITGIDMRSTKDLDATIVGKDLTVKDIEIITRDIVLVDLSDEIQYQFVRSEEIMMDNNYPCCRIHLRALLGAMDAKIEIDMTTGDVITPREITFGFPALFGNERISVLAYNLETILAEKITAILDLGVFNTRAKDFYDIYLLTSTFADKLDKTILKDALRNTLHHRNKEVLLADIQGTVLKTLNSNDIKFQWEKYRSEYPYAADIDFGKVANSLLQLFEWLGVNIGNRKEPPRKKSLLGELERNKKIIAAEKATQNNYPATTKKKR